jgi:hypothetical protein
LPSPASDTPCPRPHPAEITRPDTVVSAYEPRPGGAGALAFLLVRDPSSSAPTRGVPRLAGGSAAPKSPVGTVAGSAP